MPKRLVTFLSVLLIPAGMAVVLIVHNFPARTAVGHQVVVGGSCETNGFCAPTSTHPAATTSTVETNATVVRAVDGDTLVVTLDAEPGEWKIRLLGINTPETVDPRKPVECFGKEASHKMHGMVDGQRIRLEGDPQADEQDKYGRLLRNVFLSDGTDVNALMVREGFAYAYLSFPLNRQRKVQLRDLQAQAQASSTGLWSPSACSGKT